MLSRRTLAALALASVAHIASAQECGAAWTCQSFADAIPACPRSCFNQELMGCDADDWACRCTYKNTVLVETSDCVLYDCEESNAEAQQALEDLCSCVASNGNPSPACAAPALPSSSVVVVVSSAAPVSSAPASIVSSAVSASVTPSSSVVPISSFPVFSSVPVSSAPVSSVPVSSAPISSAPSSVISSVSSAVPSDEPCTDDSESCTPPASTLATYMSYSAIDITSTSTTSTSSEAPVETPILSSSSARYPFANSSTTEYVVKPTDYPVGGGYPHASKPAGGYMPGLYPNSTTITTAVYPGATTTTSCTDDKVAPTTVPAPGSGYPSKPGHGNNGGEYKPAPGGEYTKPVEEKPYEGVPSEPKPEYPGSGSGSGLETGPYPGSGSDSAPETGSGSYPGSGSDTAPYPSSGSGSGSGSYPTSGSGYAPQPVASTSVSAVLPVGKDDEYVVTAGVSRGAEFATGGVVFAAVIVALGLF
ncbi:hypothetical protein V8F20_005989 [Naviculisporaceae sp. PSN 640]